MTVDDKTEYRHLAGLVLLCIVVYGWTLGYGFVWDDVAFIQEGRVIQHLSNIPSMFVSNLWEGTGQSSSYYRPLPQVISALDFYFWGRNPFGYHLTNIILHAVCSSLVYLLAARVLRNPLPAFCAALLFAVHPAHAETVAWVGARSEMLPAIFMFAALYAHLRFRDGSGRGWLVAGLFCFWCALLSKEMAVTLPALLVLVSVGRGDRWKPSLGWGAIYGTLLVPYFAVRAAVLGSAGMGGDPLGTRIATAIVLYARYLRELVFPVIPKACFYVPSKASLLDSEAIVSTGILLGVVAVTVLLWKRNRIAAVGLAWILVSLLPVSGLPAIIKPFAMANRYLYIPSFGLALVVAPFWSHLNESAARIAARPKALLGVALLGLLCALTVSRLHYWRSDKEFYSKCVEDAPDYGVAVGNLGGILLKEQRPDEAKAYLERAYALVPGNLNVINNLAYLLMTKGELARAGELLHKASGINRNHYLTRFNLATLYSLQGDFAVAEREFADASRISPHRPEPYLRLGNLCLKRRDYDCAIAQFSRVLERAPANAAAFAGLGNSYAGKGMPDKARDAFGKALALNPDDQSVRRSLQQVQGSFGGMRP